MPLAVSRWILPFTLAGGLVISITAAAAPLPAVAASPAKSRQRALSAADTAAAREAIEALFADAGLFTGGPPPARLNPRAEALPGGGERIFHHPRFLNTDRVADQPGALLRLSADPDRKFGASPDGRMMLFAPDPVQPGSSISHWDTRATPDLLMEPFLRPGLSGDDPDLTVPLLEDLGWRRGSAHFMIVPLDRPEAGLFDPRPFPGAPGNPATTLGQARLNVLEHVLSVWEGIVASAVPIDVSVVWLPLFCQPGVGAALAGAGPTGAFAQIEGLPSPELWYPAALAESLVGRDLTGPVTPTGGGDITVGINLGLDDGCRGPGTSWYYGLDGNEPDGQIDLAAVLLHELGHGLGMAGFVDPFTGALLSGRGSIYDRFLTDRDTGRGWLELSAAQRARSARSHGRLVWSGPKVTAAAPSRLAGGAPTLTVLAPAELAGDLPVGTAIYGPALSADPIELPLGCLVDGVADPTPLNGCTAALGASPLAGSVGLVDDGGCTPVNKSRQVQAAGGVAALVANQAGQAQFTLRPVNEETGDIHIPTLSLGAEDGRRLRQAACPKTAGYARDGRFQITATWRTRSGSGVAAFAPLTADSTSLSFSNPDNVEAVVKVLDACTQQQRPSYWIFAAGLTNVEVALTVLDTEIGVGKTYTNPLGQPFAPILDTSALPTCP